VTKLQNIVKNYHRITSDGMRATPRSETVREGASQPATGAPCGETSPRAHRLESGGSRGASGVGSAAGWIRLGLRDICVAGLANVTKKASQSPPSLINILAARI
jgi:hypothetical protein